MRVTLWRHRPAHDLLWQGAPTCWMPDCTTPSEPHHGPDVRDQRSAYDALSNGGGARLPWR